MFLFIYLIFGHLLAFSDEIQPPKAGNQYLYYDVPTQSKVSCPAGVAVRTPTRDEGW